MQTLYEQTCFQDSSSSVLFTVQRRGPRYEAYAKLRESKLMMRNRIMNNNNNNIQQQQKQEDYEEELIEPNHHLFTSSPPPLPQHIKERAVAMIQSSPVKNAGRSIVGRSVPNFSAVLRKENRKPVAAAEVKTPPMKGRAGVSKLGSAGLSGSKSANGCGEKRGGGGMMAARRSCANIHELQVGLSYGVSSSAINDSDGGRGRIVTRGGVNSRAVLGSSRLY